MHECRNCQIEPFTLADGRKAERHTHTDPDGRQVIDILAEAPNPMRLETRVTTTHEALVDGVFKPVAGPTNASVQILDCSHQPVAEAPVTAAQVAEIVEGAINKMLDGLEPVATPEAPTMAFVSAQSIVENNVAQTKKERLTFNLIMAAILVAQAAFFGYLMFAM